MRIDIEELICNCKAITLKQEEADKISFIGNMKKKGTKLAAYCLSVIILLTRKVTQRVKNNNVTSMEVSTRNQS